MALSDQDKQKYIIEMTDELLAVPKKWNANEDLRLTDMDDLADIMMNAFISFGGAFIASFVTSFCKDDKRENVVADIVQQLITLVGKNLVARDDYIKNNPSEFKLQ